jgi:hypothetical protein
MIPNATASMLLLLLLLLLPLLMMMMATLLPMALIVIRIGSLLHIRS